jgi:hypothetical protein
VGLGVGADGDEREAEGRGAISAFRTGPLPQGAAISANRRPKIFQNSERSCNKLKLRHLDVPVSIAAAKTVTTLTAWDCKVQF